MHGSHSKLERLVFMACLIIAGETIFALPFHIARFFRPTLLAALDFSNAPRHRA